MCVDGLRTHTHTAFMHTLLLLLAFLLAYEKCLHINRYNVMLLYPPCSCCDIIPVFLSLFYIHSNMHRHRHRHTLSFTHLYLYSFVLSLFVIHACTFSFCFFLFPFHAYKLYTRTDIHSHVLCSSPLETRALCDCTPSFYSIRRRSFIHTARERYAHIHSTTITTHQTRVEEAEKKVSSNNNNKNKTDTVNDNTSTITLGEKNVHIESDWIHSIQSSFVRQT